MLLDCSADVLQGDGQIKKIDENSVEGNGRWWWIVKPAHRISWPINQTFIVAIWTI